MANQKNVETQPLTGPRVPRGGMVERSDAEIEALSTVTPKLEEKVRATAIPEARALMEATDAEDEG